MGKKVLVVDNDRFMLAFMVDLLTEQGHEVRTALDGLAAMEVLKTYVPDVVFLDLIMPNIGGDKLCRMIRRMPDLQDVRIAFVSAVAAEEPARLAELGVNALIAKGPLAEMSKQILDVLEGVSIPAPAPHEDLMPDLKGISPRGITQELLGVQRHLRTLLNNLSEGVLELNPEEKVIFVNNSALAIWGVSEEDVLGKPFLDLFEEPERRRIADVLKSIGSGLPEAIDPVSLQIHGEPVSLKLLPVEDNLNWSVMVIAVPIRKIAYSPCPNP